MPAKKSSKRKKRIKRSKSPGFTGWAIIFLSVFIVVFVLSMALTTSEVSVSKTSPGIIRLQLLNGCGVNGAAEQIAKALMESQSTMLFDIIDKSNAKVYNFNKTLVIDRKGSDTESGGFSGAASYVARLLNIGSDQLLIQKLSDNLLDIDVSIIIGSDYKLILKTLTDEVE
ncbi:MAG: hypothetical protein B6D58_00665 [candidate division Zixibacteria bacterium 4484_95]|nr:MAG: hypothetical protein B6D58_00665 [candidate division Zixibacteria bacterium 4484_95]